MTAAQRLAPKCAACGSKDEVEESMCAACYTAMPMDEWVSAERLASMGRHPSNGVATTTVDYGNADNTPDPDRQDAAWYCVGDSHGWAATVYRGQATIHIYSDGEMNINLYDGDRRIRTDADLYDAEITNDKQLYELCEGGALEWVNNPWFDLYDADSGQHLDTICHTLNDAVNAAVELIEAPGIVCDNCGAPAHQLCAVGCANNEMGIAQ